MQQYLNVKAAYSELTELTKHQSNSFILSELNNCSISVWTPNVISQTKIMPVWPFKSVHCRIWPFPLIAAGGSSSSLGQIQCLQDIYSLTSPEIQGREGATQDVRVLLCKYCRGRMSHWRRQLPSKVCRFAQWKTDLKRLLLHANTVVYHNISGYSVLCKKYSLSNKNINQ